MDTYLTGSVVWPDGWTKLRVYFVPRLEEIKSLCDVYRPVLEEFDFLSPIADEWLHETVAVVDDRPTHAVRPAEMTLLESLLREGVGALEGFTVTAGGALASRHGVMLDLTPDDEYGELWRRVTSAIVEVFGREAAHYEGGRPHIPLAYGTGRGDSGQVQGRLRNATCLRVPLTVAEVLLADATQDVARHRIRWRELARIPLASTP